MAIKEYKRPDEAAMLRVLENNYFQAVGLILRFAWKMGLSREEIRQLTWNEIDFSNMEITLPGRRTPIDEETGEILKKRFDARSAQNLRSEFVVVSDRKHEQMSSGTISRSVRSALDTAGLSGISVEDLRQDFIIRNLEEHGLSHTARISGQAISSLYNNYSQFIPERERKSTAAPEDIDEYLLWQLMQNEGTSSVGIMLRLVWQAGLYVNEVLSLTWEEVDLEEGMIHLPDRAVPTGAALKRLLQQVKDGRSPTADPHVLLTPNSQKPYDAPRISSVAKTALIRAGIEHVTLDTLVKKKRRKTGEEKILRMCESGDGITRHDVEALLQVTERQAYEKLCRLAEQGSLVKVGTKYYRAGTVVPPEDHYEQISAYLKEAGAAYRKDLADLLHLEAKQCSWILRKFVEEGKLTRVGQRYDLPKKEA